MSIIHGIILRETRESLEASGRTSSGLEQDISGECNRDSKDGTGGRECRVTIINPKKFPVSPSLLYPLKDYFQNALSYSIWALKLIKARSVHSHTNP